MVRRCVLIRVNEIKSRSMLRLLKQIEFINSERETEGKRRTEAEGECSLIQFARYFLAKYSFNNIQRSK